MLKNTKILYLLKEKELIIIPFDNILYCDTKIKKVRMKPVCEAHPAEDIDFDNIIAITDEDPIHAEILRKYTNASICCNADTADSSICGND